MVDHENNLKEDPGCNHDFVEMTSRQGNVVSPGEDGPTDGKCDERSTSKTEKLVSLAEQSSQEATPKVDDQVGHSRALNSNNHIVSSTAPTEQVTVFDSSESGVSQSFNQLELGAALPGELSQDSSEHRGLEVQSASHHYKLEDSAQSQSPPEVIDKNQSQGELPKPSEDHGAEADDSKTRAEQAKDTPELGKGECQGDLFESSTTTKQDAATQTEEKEINPENPAKNETGRSEEVAPEYSSKASSAFDSDAKGEKPLEVIPEDIQDESPSRLEWIRQKQEEGAVNREIDQMMCLIGRENIKAELLYMKAVIEGRQRRDEDLCQDACYWELTGNRGSGRNTIKKILTEFEKKMLPNQDGSKWRGALRHLRLDDVSDEEIGSFLCRLLKQRSLEVEGGPGGIYIGLLAQRIGQNRGTSSFKNFWTVRSEFSAVVERQSQRIQRERVLWKKTGQQGDAPSDWYLTKEDLLGDPPKDIRRESQAYKELQAMVGLGHIKMAVEELIDLARVNYDLEIRGKVPIHAKLNRVFLGPPGTGKTTVAKLFGQIVDDLGLLSKHEVVVTGPSDFISDKIGRATVQTRRIMDETLGKVLIIDDMSQLCPQKSTKKATSGADKTLHDIIDTIVAKTSTEPGQNRCIILMGYKEEMQDMFDRVNPGLRSRFPLEDAFELQDYDLPELLDIMDGGLAKAGVDTTVQAKEVASQVLGRIRDRPNFGNGRDVKSLIDRARTSHNRRLKIKLDAARDGSDDAEAESPGLKHASWLGQHVTLEPEDFDPEWNRGSIGSGMEDIFQAFVGFESIVEQFRRLQHIVAGLRKHGKDPRPHIPFTFVFKGPPGTGKTSTARKLGQIFYDMGFLSKAEVIECSATDLIGQYLGHTGPIVRALLDRALGKVLFIDEAYRLGVRHRGTSGSSFEEEAVGELVDSLTKLRYARKIVVILAGYSEDMDVLMKSNRGLRGRFATEVIFSQLNSQQCLLFLGQLVGKMDIVIRDKTVPRPEVKEKVHRLFNKLSTTRDWSNGRDIETLSQIVIGEVFRKEGSKQTKSDRLQISTDELVVFLQDMLRARLAGELQDRDSME